MSLSPRAIGPFRYNLLDSEPFYETRMSLLWLADTSDPVQRKSTRVILKVARLKEEQFSLANERAINNEERWLRKLHHPGIIKLRPIAEEGKSRPGQEIYRARSTLPGNPWFVVTDYLPGGTLQALVQERKRLNVLLALQITQALTETLHYIHTQGCIHQDFKPRNVLFVQKPQAKLTEQSRPILIDFGIAGQQGDQQSISGTRPWLPPESERAHRTGDKLPSAPSMDVYALGVVLYYMLTGKRPPEATANIATRLRISADDLLDLPTRNQEAIANRINQLISACVQDDPTKRPSTRQVKQALDQLLALLPKASWPQLPRISRRLAGVLVVVALLIAIFVYNFWGADSNNAPAPAADVVTTPPAPATVTPVQTTSPTMTLVVATPVPAIATTAPPATLPVVVPSPTTIPAVTNTLTPTLTATTGVTLTATPTATLSATAHATSTLAPTATPSATPTLRPATFTPRPATPTPAA